jgi:hypothetical protein
MPGSAGDDLVRGRMSTLVDTLGAPIRPKAVKERQMDPVNFAVLALDGDSFFVGKIEFYVVPKLQIVPRNVVKHFSVCVFYITGLPIPMNLPLPEHTVRL